MKRYRLFVNLERRGRLEICHHYQANFTGNLKIVEGRTKYRQSCIVRAMRSLQVLLSYSLIKLQYICSIIRNDKEKYYKKVREFADTMKKKDWFFFLYTYHIYIFSYMDIHFRMGHFSNHPTKNIFFLLHIIKLNSCIYHFRLIRLFYLRNGLDSLAWACVP